MNFWGGLLILALILVPFWILVFRLWQTWVLFRKVGKSRVGCEPGKYPLKYVSDTMLADSMSSWSPPSGWPTVGHFVSMTAVRRRAYLRLVQDKAVTWRLVSGFSDLALSAILGGLVAWFSTNYPTVNGFRGYTVLMALFYGLLVVKGLSMRSIHYDRLARTYRPLAEQ